jgi:hypothetical protein
MITTHALTGKAFDNQRAMWLIQASGPGPQYANNSLLQTSSGGYSTSPTSYSVAGSNTSYQKPTGQVLGASTGPSSNGGSTSSAPQRAGGVTPDGSYSVGYNGSAQGPSQDQINAAINDAYNSTNGYLDQAEQQVNADYPTVQKDIQGQFDTSSGQLGVTNAANNAQFGTQQDKTDYNNQNALAQSRALYDQLRTGYQQKFGGSTSAGGASNEIANVEQQRQMGQTNRSYNDASTSIQNNKVQSDAQFQQNSQALTTQRDASLNQANRDFQNKLLQIGQARASNEQAKGQARLQALQDLRNSVNSINLQNQQFKDQMQLYSTFAGNTTGGYNSTSASLLNNANSAALSFGNQPAASSGLQVGGSQPQQTQQLSGQVGSTPHLDPTTGQWVY